MLLELTYLDSWSKDYSIHASIQNEEEAKPSEQPPDPKSNRTH